MRIIYFPLFLLWAGLILLSIGFYSGFPQLLVVQRVDRQFDVDVLSLPLQHLPPRGDCAFVSRFGPLLPLCTPRVGRCIGTGTAGSFGSEPMPRPRLFACRHVVAVDRPQFRFDTLLPSCTLRVGRCMGTGAGLRLIPRPGLFAHRHSAAVVVDRPRLGPRLLRVPHSLRMRHSLFALLNVACLAVVDHALLYASFINSRVNHAVLYAPFTDSFGRTGTGLSVVVMSAGRFSSTIITSNCSVHLVVMPTFNDDISYHCYYYSCDCNHSLISFYSHYYYKLNSALSSLSALLDFDFLFAVNRTILRSPLVHNCHRLGSGLSVVSGRFSSATTLLLNCSVHLVVLPISNDYISCHHHHYDYNYNYNCNSNYFYCYHYYKLNITLFHISRISQLRQIPFLIMPRHKLTVSYNVRPISFDFFAYHSSVDESKHFNFTNTPSTLASHRIKWCRLSLSGLLTNLLLAAAGVETNPGPVIPPPRRSERQKNLSSIKSTACKPDKSLETDSSITAGTSRELVPPVLPSNRLGQKATLISMPKLNNKNKNKNYKPKLDSAQTFPTRNKGKNKCIKFKQTTQSSGNSTLLIGLLNIQSVRLKGPAIKDLILDKGLDLLILTESWLTTALRDVVSADMTPDGYLSKHYIRNHTCSKKRGGGISIIYRSSILCSEIVLASPATTYERIACKVTVGSRIFTLACIYRPPPAPTAGFFVELSDFLDELILLHGCPIIAGDFNCPAIGAACDQRLLDTMVGYGLSQGVLDPTHRGSCEGRDNILDLLFHPPDRSGIVGITVEDPGLSDHFLVLAHFAITKPLDIAHTFKTRNIRNMNRQAFADQISLSPFITDPSDSLDVFCAQIRHDVISVLDCLAPVTEITKRPSKHPPYSLSSEAQLAKRQRRTLERRFVRCRTQANRDNYKAACKKALRLIRISSQQYTRSLVDAAHGNSKKLWVVCKSLLHGVDRAVETVQGLTSSSFNNFFQNKIKQIKIKISETLPTLVGTYDYKDIPDTSHPGFVCFNDVSLETVTSVIRGMNSKSNMLDFMPTFLLKECVTLFAPSITHLCNMSLLTGFFPTEFKVGCITPILKKKGMAVNDHASYRPITGLNTLSKIVEKVALLQLRPVIVGSPNFATMQSAYRTAHSTETALLRLTSDVRSAMGRSSAVSLLSLDISAAFDALDHSTLLLRAERKFGIGGQALQWLRSYLTGRTTFTKLGNNISPVIDVISGVPQGSILGPILFALYISPIGSLVTSMGVHYHQYADDTQLYVELMGGSSSDKLTECADMLSLWFLHNDLMLNTTKTECIVFGTGARLRNTDRSTLETCVPFTGTILPVMKSIHILGVTLDTELSMNNHVAETVSGCNAHVRALRHIRPCLTESVAASLACAIVQTRLDYCNSLLYQTSAQNIVKLQRVQDNLARVVCRTHRRESAKPLLKRLHWLPIATRIRYKIAAVTHSVIHTGQPAYLSQLISRSTNTRGTRDNPAPSSAACPAYALKLNAPRCRLAVEKPSFCSASPAVWNSLTESLRSIASPEAFRKALKTELFLSSSS